MHDLSLPEEIEDYDNQFSGLYISKGKLFILSESRLQDNAAAKLYAINLFDLDRKIADTSYKLPYQKYPMYNLGVLRHMMAAENQSYEGLEAIVIDGDNVYISVETNTPSTNCYLIKGVLNDTAIILKTDFLIPIPKPVASDGSHIYNAGFEAIMKKEDKLFAFFEYNYFPAHNYVYSIKDTTGDEKTKNHLIKKLPFRITDITPTGKNRYTAINFFFNGEGADTIYRTSPKDPNSKLIKTNAGYRNYSRLIDIEFRSNSFTWKPLWEFPAKYNSYNWEGIAAYKGGYFIMNDKYTPARPYKTVLLYFKKVN